MTPHSTRYVDRIWHCKQLLWAVRTSFLELHKAGVLAHIGLSDDTLTSLNSSGLDKANGLQLLVSFCSSSMRCSSGRRSRIPCTAILCAALFVMRCMGLADGHSTRAAASPQCSSPPSYLVQRRGGR
jgi:hypothetical protein